MITLEPLSRCLKTSFHTTIVFLTKGLEVAFFSLGRGAEYKYRFKCSCPDVQASVRNRGISFSFVNQNIALS